jgi:hypothetical protein
MIFDPLRKLVEDAGAADRPATLPLPRADDLLAALAARRRWRAHRRRIVLCGAIILALAGWRALDSRHSAAPDVVAKRPSAPVLDVETVRARLEQLDREAALHQSVIQGLANVTPMEDPNSSASSHAHAAPEQFSQEVARSAAISWRYATLVDQEFDDAAAARREYQRVVTRFPDTPWAREAAQSLRNLPAPENSQPL